MMMMMIRGFRPLDFLWIYDWYRCLFTGVEHDNTSLLVD